MRRQVGANIKKLLPSLSVGLFITLLALAVNFLMYRRQLPLLMAEAGVLRQTAGEEAGQPAPARIGNPVNYFFTALLRLVSISDDLITDIMIALSGHHAAKTTYGDIAIIAVDGESLQRVGGWPWSRRNIAKILAKASDAKVLGLDLLFDEPDQTSLINYVDRFERLLDRRLDPETVELETLDNDIYLARALARANSVIGTVLHSGQKPARVPASPNHNYTLKLTNPAGEDVPLNEVLLKNASFAMTDIPPIRRDSTKPLGEGFMNLFPSVSGALRPVSMFAHLPPGAFSDPLEADAVLHPSLPLEMIRVALGGNGYRIEVRKDKTDIPDVANPGRSFQRYPVKSVSITAGKDMAALLTVPLSEFGEMEVSFRNRRGDYTVYPAWEVLEGMHDGAFKDKLVVVGGLLHGIGYGFTSVGSPAAGLPLPEAHATILSTMLRGDFIQNGRLDDYFWQQVMIFLSGLAVTLALIFGSLGLGMTVSLLALVGLVALNYALLFGRGINVGLTMPLASTMAVLVAQMVANYLIIGRERRFIRKAFSLNVSPSLLGYLETHPDRLSSLQGEHRDMTVMFSDIRGFTSISERMTAPDLARFLNEYFTPMSDIVMQNMGTVDKFIGDALMAFWNAPADNPRHARDAARSALEMVNKLSELQLGWTSRGLPRVSIGCGINSGPMFAGYMGSEQRKNYTVMGDNVNIASRLESLNKLYSSNILITEATRNQLGNGFRCRVTDKVRLSGKEEPVLIYELLGEGMSSEEEFEELAAFARVFELYQQREFPAAEALLKELLFIRPTPIYRMHLDRLAVYLALPPPDDWDGTFSMSHK